MKSRIYLVVTSAMVLVALVAWLGRHELQGHRDELRKARAKRSRIANELSGAQEKLFSAQRAQSELQAALDETHVRNDTHKAATKRDAAGAASNKAKSIDRISVMEAHPELRALNMALKRADTRLRFLPVFHALSLSAEQKEKFQTLMVNAEEESVDLLASARAQGLDENDPDLLKLKEQEKSKLEAGQKEILGEAGMRELDRFTRAEQLGVVVGRVSGLVATTQTPFTEATAEQFFDVLKNANAPFTAGGRADLMATDWPRVLAEAQRVLLPTQSDALKAEANFWYVARLAVKFYEQEKAE